MTTRVKSIGVDVNLMEKSVTFMANAVIQTLFRVAHKRGLDPDYLQSNLPAIEAGLVTWLAEEKLLSLLLQVYLPGRDDALEDWETAFEYYADPFLEVQKPPIEQIEEACQQLAGLPAGAGYRVYARLAPDATEVAGWVPGTPLTIDADVEQEFDGTGFGHIGGKIRYRGGHW